MTDRPGVAPERLLLLSVVVWGVNFPVLKVALTALHPFVLNALRLSVSALVLGGVYVGRADGSPLAPLVRVPGTVVGLGLLGFVCFPVAFILGVDATTAGTAALVMASAPLWTAVVSRALGVETLSRRAWGGLGVAVAGTALVVATGTGAVDLSGATLVGNALVALAALLWGTYTVVSRPALEECSPMALTFFGVVAALPVLWALALPHLGTADLTGLAPATWGAVLYAGAFGTGLAFVWWNAAVKAVGPSKTGVYNNGVPVVALAAGAVALDEPVGPVQLVGAALVLLGVTVVRRSATRTSERYDRLQTR